MRKQLYNLGAMFGLVVLCFLLLREFYHKAYSAGFMDGVDATMTILKSKGKRPTKQNRILIDTVRVDSFIGRWKI